MITTPVISTSEYRGKRIYVRRLGKETFEYLIAWDNEIFCNQVELQKEAGSRMRAYTDEETKSAVDFMRHVAQEFCDDKFFALEQYNGWEQRFGRAKKKVVNLFEDIKYKFLNYLDEKHKQRESG